MTKISYQKIGSNAENKKLLKHVQEILKIKDERNISADKKAHHYGKFKFYLGREQELTRNLNDKIEEFEAFRVK